MCENNKRWSERQKLDTQIYLPWQYNVRFHASHTSSDLQDCNVLSLFFKTTACFLVGDLQSSSHWSLLKIFYRPNKPEVVKLYFTLCNYAYKKKKNVLAATESLSFEVLNDILTPFQNGSFALIQKPGVTLYIHPSPYADTYMKADNSLPVGQGWRRKWWPGFTWWLMPHNQSICQRWLEIRSWTFWSAEVSDPSTIHLCPHLVLQNFWFSTPPLDSLLLTKQADAGIS